MRLKYPIFKIFIYCSFILWYPVYAQQFLDEMELLDISDNQDIRSTIIRDPQQALLIVKTQISTMRIQSNNIIHKSEQVEPGTWHIHVAPGTHRISFQAEQFISVQRRFYFNAKEVIGIMIRVIPAARRKEEKNTGIVVIQSEPDSAEVYLNDQYYGITPYIGKILAGRYKLGLKREPFLPYEQPIIIISNETLPVNITLNRTLGSMEVYSNPNGVEIELDGQIIGVTPLNFSKIEKGNHILKASLEYYNSFTTEFSISEEKKSHKFNIVLKPKESQLMFKGAPQSALVKINGEELGNLPIERTNINYGIYNLHVSKPGFHSHEQRITIEKSEPYIYEIKLKPKSKPLALLYSAVIPGSGQIYSDRITQGAIIGGTALFGVAFSILSGNNYASRKEDYLADRAEYDNNTDLGKMNDLYVQMQNSYDTMEKAYDTKQIVLGITAAIWLYNLIDVILFFPGQEGFYFTSNAHGEHTMLTLSLEL